jgi:hypothetical protein
MNKYVSYYHYKYNTQYKNESKAEELNKELKKLAEGLRFKQVQSMRQAALIKYAYLMKLLAIDDKINTINDTWPIISLFTESSDKAKLEELNSWRDQLKAEEHSVKRAIQVYLDKEKVVYLEEYNDMADDYVRFDFDFYMGDCGIFLAENEKTNLLGLHLVDITVKALLGFAFQKVFLNLHDYYINQYIEENPNYLKLIETYQDESKLQLKGEEYTDVNKKGALFVAFVNYIKDPQKSRLIFQNERRMLINASIFTLQSIASKLGESLIDDINISEIVTQYKGQVDDYILKGLQQNTEETRNK